MLSKGGVDATNGGTNIQIELTYLALNGVDVAVTVGDTAFNFDTQVFSLPSSGVFTTAVMPFSAFVGVDLTDLDFISLTIDSIASGDDASFTFFGAAPSNTPVGGTILPIDTTALLVAGAQTTTPWLILGVVSAVGIGLAVFTLKRR